MPTVLPLDDDSNPIPAIRLKSDGAHAVPATNASARNATAFGDDTKIVSLYATGPVYIRFGVSGVTASALDHYFPSGIYYDFSLGGGKVPHYTHLAVLAAGDDCTVYVSEKE